ncbi:acetyltransferase (GNAT) family protein [Volucribacter psittacicida]|uniref:Acetyltransferase (GNAT) family protein n=1 Tax=Volucribacter psittacicida TaxID=203482 RepID=A0A4R1G4Z8_9PAST|nr:GNAT family N-acetyltransferase [Volucribacter psittacicida]TCJ98771.1 acetyltransferase (GNAT) family protein [Volucribacter psittacicida]
MKQYWQPIAITEQDLEKVYQLCLSNPNYYQAMKEPLTLDKIRQNLTALPPQAKAEHKFYWGYWHNQTLIAVLEGVFHYPTEDCVLIGFFMVDQSWQRQGIGASIIQQFLNQLDKSGISQAILSYPSDSESSHRFWLNCGFTPTGECDEYEDLTLVVMAWGEF